MNERAQGRCLRGAFHFGGSSAESVGETGANRAGDRLASGSLSRQEVRGFLTDFHELTYTKWRLSSENMSAPEREKTQERYNLLLKTYFVPKAS